MERYMHPGCELMAAKDCTCTGDGGWHDAEFIILRFFCGFGGVSTQIRGAYL